jgi:ATP-binding cassette subfamily B protein
LLLLGERIMTTVNSVGDMYESGLYVEDFTAFLANSSLTRGATGSKPAPEAFGRISVEDVTFTYPAADTPALHGVSLTIEAGQVIALVGENGSGKTTLAKLLSRLYLPQAGTIRWDGVDLAGLDPAQVHRRIAVIFQDFARYQLTARENIGPGAVEHIDQPDIIQTAAAPGRDEGPRGHACRRRPIPLNSAGRIRHDPFRRVRRRTRAVRRPMATRVALARAFISDAPLIILDEPTASMDPRAEHDLFTRIRFLFGGRTVLLISHRYNTVRDADHIYVLNAGRIIEHGNHDQLITAAGTYAELFALQAQAYTDKPAQPNDHHNATDPIMTAPPEREYSTR